MPKQLIDPARCNVSSRARLARPLAIATLLTGSCLAAGAFAAGATATVTAPPRVLDSSLIKMISGSTSYVTGTVHFPNPAVVDATNQYPGGGPNGTPVQACGRITMRAYHLGPVPAPQPGILLFAPTAPEVTDATAVATATATQGTTGVTCTYKLTNLPKGSAVFITGSYDKTKNLPMTLRSNSTDWAPQCNQQESGATLSVVSLTTPATSAVKVSADIDVSHYCYTIH